MSLEPKMEIWKTIKGFENYQISNYGRVKSIARVSRGIAQIEIREKVMKIQDNNNGYKVIRLYSSCVRKKFLIHRLVALHFLDFIDDKEYVNHKDRDRTNNRIENLEFMTHQENMDHRDRKGKEDEPF